MYRLGRISNGIPNINMTLTREIPLRPDQSALLFVDLQNFSATRDGNEFAGIAESEIEAKYG